jgi:hypothetical protein
LSSGQLRLSVVGTQRRLRDPLPELWQQQALMNGVANIAKDRQATPQTFGRGLQSANFTMRGEIRGKRRDILDDPEYDSVCVNGVGRRTIARPVGGKFHLWRTEPCIFIYRASSSLVFMILAPPIPAVEAGPQRDDRIKSEEAMRELPYSTLNSTQSNPPRRTKSKI